MSKTAGVGLDDWKLPIFKKHLDAAGYKYEEPVQFTAGTLVLKVHFEWVHELKPIIEAAQRECAELKASQVEEDLALDLRVYGTCYWKIVDGRKVCIHPLDIRYGRDGIARDSTNSIAEHSDAKV